MNSNKNKFIIPFAGYPIFVIQNGFYVNADELNFIKNIEYQDHLEINNLKLSKNGDVLELQQLKRLKDFIKESLDDYVSNILEIDNSFSFCQSWSTIQNGKTKHPSHTHPNHLISSVYYVKTKKTELIFNIDRSILQCGYYFKYDVKNYNVFNSHSYKVILKQGDIIFFPGQLHHESSTNDEKERIVMGSSFFIDGKLGDKNNYNNIEITNNKKEKY
jgi:hypothetical protein|tara:strand:+ start:914 stop:1564 length:651 start_codon:yes stop_codon:yes gene_type:complete